MKRQDFVYLAVENDEYELPIAVFDNISEIAMYAETDYRSAVKLVSRKNLNEKNNCFFIKVYVGDV